MTAWVGLRPCGAACIQGAVCLCKVVCIGLCLRGPECVSGALCVCVGLFASGIAVVGAAGLRAWGQYACAGLWAAQRLWCVSAGCLVCGCVGLCSVCGSEAWRARGVGGGGAPRGVDDGTAAEEPLKARTGCAGVGAQRGE